MVGNPSVQGPPLDEELSKRGAVFSLWEFMQVGRDLTEGRLQE